jgi:putative tricarboxylic transport membrane protein
VVNAQLLGGLAWLAAGLFVAWSGHDLGVGTAGDPGGGFLMFWAGLLMAALAASVALGAMAGGRGARADSGQADSRDVRWGKVLAVVACLALYAAAFETLGFLAATLPLMLALLRLVDPVRWTVAVPVAFGATFGVWWVVQGVLGVQLPKGVF